MIDVLIAGAGPAGLATALYLARACPGLRMVALEKFAHPRFKTCAGGLIPKTMQALAELGLELEVPCVEVLRGSARTEAGRVELKSASPLCTVIRRDQFDARLARAARERGLEIVEHCRVLDVIGGGESVSVTTDRGEFRARVLVGADGSGSRVRTASFSKSRGAEKRAIGRALMTDLPVDPAGAEEFARRAYRFDFNCVSAGVGGYCWSFPCLIGGQPHFNVGIYEQRPPHGADGSGDRGAGGHQRMLDALRAAFPDLGLEGLGRHPASFRAFPIRWYDRADRFAKGRVILAGDAAGVDPLMGEGISCAFEHGRIAARHIALFLDSNADALERYEHELHEGAVGRKLAKLLFAANGFYGRYHRWFFRAAALSREAQRIGVDWYNGADHLDELPVRRLLARWARAMLR